MLRISEGEGLGGYNKIEKSLRSKKGEIIMGLKNSLSVLLLFLLAALFLIVGSNSHEHTAASSDSDSHTNILLLGVDEGRAMADTVMIFSFDNTTYESSVISVSRSTYVDFQTWSSEPDEYHLAFAHHYGLTNNDYDYNEAGLFTKKTVEELLGIPLHHYITLKEEGFSEFVELIGGVEIYVCEGLAEVTDLPYGLNRLDGDQAHTYVTHRLPRVPEEGSDHSDGDRVRRNQRMLNALMHQLKTLPEEELYDIYYEMLGTSLFTSMSDWDVAEVGNILYDQDPEKIPAFVLPGEYEIDPMPGYYYLDQSETTRILADLGLKLPWIRLAGESRFETSAHIASYAYPEGADTALLARGDVFVDGLGSSALAGALEAPLLLTGSDVLSEATAEALLVLEVTKVKLLGGTSAISNKVKKDLEDMGLTVRRISGDDRYSTAAKMAQSTADRLGNNFPTTAFIVSGTAMADSLVAGPVASGRSYPILLVAEDSIPEVTKEAINELGIDELIIIGGSTVVSEDVETDLEQLIDGKVERLRGANRFDTSVNVAQRFFSDPDPQYVLLGNGLTLVDALSGGYLGAILKAPVLYAQKDQLPEVVDEYYHSIADSETLLYILGGPAAVSDTVLEKD